MMSNILCRQVQFRRKAGDEIRSDRESETGGEWSAKSAFCIAEKMKASQLKAVSNFVGRGGRVFAVKRFSAFRAKLKFAGVLRMCLIKIK